MADILGAFGQPFKEQIGFFRKKLNLPTERWDDIWKAAHDRAFVVAGAAKADLLNDLHRAIEARMKAGQSVDGFRRDFRQIVEKHGWHGWTGEDTKKGEAWRARVIFETNLRTSYAAGRHRQLADPGLLKRRPWWQYVHSGSEHARPQHKAWGDSGLTLRHDAPFWETHYPPNGWGCGCTVRAVPEPEEGAATEPPEGWDAPEVIRQQDAPDALFFIDPPYVASTRGDGRYRHEMTDGQHAELLALLRGIKGRAMVSGYDSPLYDDALHDWQRIERRHYAAVQGFSARTEVLWISPPKP